LIPTNPNLASHRSVDSRRKGRATWQVFSREVLNCFLWSRSVPQRSQWTMPSMLMRKWRRTIPNDHHQPQIFSGPAIAAPGTAWRHQIRSAHFNHDRGAKGAMWQVSNDVHDGFLNETLVGGCWWLKIPLIFYPTSWWLLLGIWPWLGD
jgi:hypothetical protein